MMDSEPTFTVARTVADRFCSWLVALGGWAPSSPVERPIIHRLIRTQNPENKFNIPRQDLVVTEEGALCSIGRRYRPLFEAFQRYEAEAGVQS